MRQLNGIDAAFLQMETTTTYAHVASVSVYEPPPGRPPLALDELRRHVAARIHRAPVLRQRLLELPLELGRPYWVDDPDFDLDRHVRGADLEGPVDDERLAAYVSRMVGRRLDRSRPLWELQLIPGLAGGRFALLGIVHHAAVDGIAGRDVLATLLDREPEPAEDPAPPPWRPE
ncbi:MAG: wax ester/triacylglycerol synthase family O-acyltransferase, partial [Actinomycetota bacterium]|nr:wax ester/triacylglycerol synthase family O-acyltransferase [Actinomycetota bacterium]